MSSRAEMPLISKLRVVKNVLEKIIVSGASCLWIVATVWDVYKLQRYWFDYALEFYTSFFCVLILLFSIYPTAIPYKIYNSFRIISKINGRGFLFLFTSFLFINDDFYFHKISALVLLISGIVCLVFELLIPTTEEEKMKIKEKMERNKPEENMEKSKEIINNSSNLEKTVDIKENEIRNNKISVNEQKLDGGGGTSSGDNFKNDDKDPNPYKMPEDF